MIELYLKEGKTENSESPQVRALSLHEENSTLCFAEADRQ